MGHRHHGHASLARHEFEASFDLHELTGAGNRALRKQEHVFAALQRLDHPARRGDGVGRRHGNRAGEPEDEAEKPRHARQALVAHEADRARTRELQHRHVGVGEMIGEQQGPALGQAFDAERFYAIQATNEKPQRGGEYPGGVLGAHEEEDSGLRSEGFGTRR